MKIACLIEPSDEKFLPRIKPYFIGHNVSIGKKCPEYVTPIAKGFDACIVIRDDFLKKLTFGAKGSNLENFAGSLITYDKKPFLVLDPLEQLVTTRAGEFLTERYISKITKPDTWFKQSPFSWEVATDESVSALFERFSSSDLIAIDIETTTDGSDLITCVGYCAVWFHSDGTFSTHSIVLPFTSLFWVKWVRRFNYELAQPKIFQNGQFDNFYFLRFGCPVYNWCFDTQELFHAWYSELPKRLDAISAFLLRDVYYWKQEGKTGNLDDYYRYNAKDTWATANSWLSAISECPDWAIKNYQEKFPLVYPCLTCAFDGLKVDQAGKERMLEEQRPKLESSLEHLRKRIGKPDFNPNSSKQVVALLQAIGYKEEAQVRDTKTREWKPSANEKVLQKISKKHPLAKLLIEDILKYREAAKLLNTYVEAELVGDNRLLYALNPSGTDTGRLASSKSQFIGRGAQIQNIPPYFKQALRADDDFFLFEIDNKNSEGWCVAFLSGDQGLIETISSGRDFHCFNASKFFGIPYAELFDDATGKVLNEIIRMLAKRVNHGANYNMGAGILIETMGAENVLRAKQLLGLPASWGLYDVAEYLLEKYAEAYPRVKGVWYEYIIACIKLTHTLVSALGWTRYCLGEPWKNKPDLNAYVAHAPQNLSVGIINRGFRKVFWEIQMREWHNFRLKAQIHDSILGQYRKGRLDLVEQANRLVKQEIPVTDCSGVERVMKIPTDVKAEAELWSELTKVKFKEAA